MKRDIRVFLEDIAYSLDLVEEYTRDMKKEDFLRDTRTQDAVIRRFEVIGEAVKNVPMDFRGVYPEVPWKLLAGLRDVLIHGYFVVNLDRVWLVVKQDSPELRSQIAQILQDLD